MSFVYTSTQHQFSNLEALILLSALKPFGPATYWKLHEHGWQASDVLRLPLNELKSCMKRPLAEQILRLTRDQFSNSKKLVEDTITWCEQRNVHLISIDHPHYPPLLKEINSAPPLLYVQGHSELLLDPQLAVVGSRSASKAGRRNAFELSACLANSGISITSGLALGIDAQAHLGALSANGGTVAVIGSGIDKIYPRSNLQLAEKIVERGGCIVSEFPLGTAPQPQNFPRRNRIISGMSLGTLVVEAALKSGSLITARYALEQNREVFAMPSSIQNPMAKGCHALIKEGGVLVENCEDILRELRMLLPDYFDKNTSKLSFDSPQSELPINDADKSVMQYIEHEPQSLEQLADASGMSVDYLLSSLMSLEISGVIENTAQGYQLA